jgi:stress-induced morphogen
MFTTTEVEKMIEAGLSGAKAQVSDMTGTGDHFDAVVVAEAFEGQNLIAQHQMVYRALGDAMNGPVHALKLSTLTPTQWASQSQE